MTIEERVERATDLYLSGNYSLRQIAVVLGVAKTTIWKDINYRLPQIHGRLAEAAQIIATNKLYCGGSSRRWNQQKHEIISNHPDLSDILERMQSGDTP